MAKVFVKRGTRAQLDAAATANSLNAGEPYLITDESRIAMGTGAGAYTEAAGIRPVARLSSNQTDLAAGDYDLDTSGGTFTILPANKVGTWTFGSSNNSTGTTPVSFLDTGGRTYTDSTGAQVSGAFGFDMQNRTVTLLKTEAAGLDYRVIVSSNGPVAVPQQITVSDKPTGGSIGTPAATVDVADRIVLGQTTAGQTLSLPTPTDVAKVRTITLVGGTVDTTVTGVAAGSDSLPLLAGEVREMTWAGGAWKVTGVTLSASQVSALKSIMLSNEALYKFVGTAPGGNIYGMTTGLSAALWTTGVKLEIESSFVSARLLFANRSNAARAGFSALIGVTETAATTTSDERSVPVIGGTAYPVVAAATTTLGFRSVTFAGASTGSLAAATTKQTYVLSDEVPLTSIARSDGGTRPLLVYRASFDGTTNPWPFSPIGTTLRTPAAELRQRIIQITQSGANTVATPNGAMGLSVTTHDVFPVVRHSVPVLSVWGVGDSITQQDGVIADRISAWGYRACLEVSTPSKPVVWANFGATSRNGFEYLDAMEAALAAGAPPPNVIVTNSATINDISLAPTLRRIEAARYATHRLIGIAKKYKVPFMVMWPTMPYIQLDATEDALRKALNSEMEALANANNIYWLSASALMGDGATPERFLPATDFGDGLHPSEASSETIMVPALVRILRTLLFLLK